VLVLHRRHLTLNPTSGISVISELNIFCFLNTFIYPEDAALSSALYPLIDTYNNF